MVYSPTLRAGGVLVARIMVEVLTLRRRTKAGVRGSDRDRDRMEEVED